MKKTLGALVLGAFFLSGTPVLAQDDSKKEAVSAEVTMQSGLQNLSAMQALLEFFFMETGLYPSTLVELNSAFNTELPRGAVGVPMPRDPATGKRFVYRSLPSGKGYTLSFPDATLYGLEEGFEFKPISWGWLALRAERMRFEEMAKMSKYHIETLATSVEMYAKDHEGKFPQDLDQLYPEYIKMHPQDPVTGKNYSYKRLADGYVVRSPNPEQYGLKVFQYSSSQGIQVEALSPEK